MVILSLNLQERARVLNSLTGESKFVWTLEREAAFNEKTQGSFAGLDGQSGLTESL